MTADHPIRRALSRVCSDDTMSRVVDPTLADMRVETHRPAWRGYLVLARALTVHAVTSLPGTCARVYMDDERAIPRAVALSLIGALVAALPLVAMPLVSMGRQAANQPLWIQAAYLEMWILLLPQAIVVTLPAGLLLAFPLAFRSRDRTRTLTRRAIVLALVFVVATAAVAVWGVPRANQGFRTVMVKVANGKEVHLTPGPNEMGFRALRERIDVLNLTPGGRVEARPLEYFYGLRLALISAPLPLGLLALALTSSSLGHRRPWLTGTGALVAYTCAVFPLYMGAGLLMRASSLPAAIFAWLPTATILLVAGVTAHVVSKPSGKGPLAPELAR